MRPKIRNFLAGYYQPGSFLAVAQEFLSHQIKRGVSQSQISHLFCTLHPMGLALNNPHMRAISAYTLREYQEGLWLKYAPATIRGLVGDIAHFFKWATKKGYYTKKENPAKRLKKPRHRPGKSKAAEAENVLTVARFLASKLRRVLYRDVFKNLQNGGDNWTFDEVKAVRDLFALLFLYETGCRAGELCKLSVRAMNESLFNSSDQVAYTVVSIGKTGDKPLRFTRATAEVYRIWRDVRADYSPYALTSWSRGEAAIRPMTTRGLSHMLERRCQQAGVAIFRPHSLRHAKVKRTRLEVGLDLAKELMGHSTIVMTQNYDDITGDELSRAAALTGWNLGDLW